MLYPPGPGEPGDSSHCRKRCCQPDRGFVSSGMAAAGVEADGNASRELTGSRVFLECVSADTGALVSHSAGAEGQAAARGAGAL